ncbi:MAG: peptidoglycan editing factor PgeF [Phycisphaeraceae bacterium]
MLERTEHDNGVVTFQSPRLREAGVTHAFSTRLGGVSKGPYASLNLATLEKSEQSDANTAVAENFRRLRRALGCERAVRVEVKQVHGTAVWSPPADPVKPSDAPQADALVTDRPNQLLTVRVADCVPVLLAERTGRVVAAVHAGWRGVVAGVVPETLKAMHARFDVPAEAVVAAIGPHIGVTPFEVGPEVAEAFEAAALAETIDRTIDVKPHVDLGRAVRCQLQRGGVPAAAIDDGAGCTYQQDDLFFSYRRDGTRSGRMAAVIGRA